MTAPRIHRRRLYDYIEDLLDRDLTCEEHDKIRELVRTYSNDAFKPTHFLKQLFCNHDWKVEQVEISQVMKSFIKCRKCDLFKWVRS